MASFRSEPFLWIHLAGLATVPLFLLVVWLGLGMGVPFPFFGLELLFIAAVGIAPVFWMQWYRPFDIFSVLILSIKPERLSEQQQRILGLLQTNKQRLLTAIAAVFMFTVLWGLYQLAPIASVSFLPQSRSFGLLLAALAFLASNLFLQVPVSVIAVLFTSQQQFEQIEPLAPEIIFEKFTIPGLQVEKIFPSPGKESD
jgi:hypothetical protein